MNLMEDLSKEIDERKKAGERLRVSEEKFKDLLKNFPNGSVNVYDKNYRYIYADGKALLSNNFSKEKLIGKTIYDIFPKEKYDYLIGFFKKVWNGTEISFEFDLNNKFYMINAVPLFQGLNKVYQIMVITQDITELKTASIEISKNQAYLNSIFKAASIGIGVISNKKIQFVNEKLCSMLGYKQNELIDRNLRICFHSEEEFNKVDKLLHNGDFSGSVQDIETKIKSKDDKIIDILMTSSHIDLEDNSKGIIVTFLDISDRKNVEKEILAYQEALRNLYANIESMREKERKAISREIHDDLGQNLTALKIDTKRLHKVIDNNEKSEEIFQQIEELLNSTIHNVREISANLRPDMLDNLGLEAAIKAHSQKFEERTGIKCQLTIENIHDLTENISIAVFRIIQEAMTNVFRHANASEVLIKIYRLNKYLNGSITDNGKGIPMNKVKDFNSLGLISMRERAANLNGNLKITSSKTGSIVSFKIPL
jgi:PAS domain S-box-containing protein